MRAMTILSGIGFCVFATAAAAQPASWSISGQPAVRIGEVDGEAPYLFSRVGNAVLTADGLVAVANGGSNEIRLFDRRGSWMRSVGRAGQGPGEFRYLARVLKLPDGSLLGVDAFQSRVSVFTTAGAHVRTETMPVRAAPEAILGDGSYVMIAESGTPGQTGILEYVGHILRIQPGATQVDTLAAVAGGQGYWMQAPNGSMSQAELPFKRVLSRAFFRNAIYTGNGQEYAIAIHDASSGSGVAVRRQEPARRVSAADIERYRQVALASVAENRRQNLERVLGQVPFPEVMPHFSSLLIDSEDCLWVQRYQPNFDDAVSWDVFDARGNPLMQLRGPAGLRATEIGADYILGVQTDEQGVEYVVLHNLTRR